MSRLSGLLLSFALLATALFGVPQGDAVADIALPTGFQEQIVFSGLTEPTNLEFASDGRVFVAEKSGKIKVFDSLSDPTPTLFADLSAQVFNNWDRGLLGLALHPNFPTQPWVYVLYTRNAPPGQNAPHWPADNCIDVGGENGARCVVTSRLSRLQANGNTMILGSEQVLIGSDDWCQQFPSHSTGDLAFGDDGMLYVSAGDGASFGNADRGQYGTPTPNPCGDPENEGGAFRSQDVRSNADPAGLDGTVIRIDPVTGAAASGNPFIGSADLRKRRVVGFGLRNPFRFTIRPGTNDLWLGDVGWQNWEEINRIPDPLAATPRNFGWPCYEGNGVMQAYADFESPLCQTLYPAGGDEATPPVLAYPHRAEFVSDRCTESNGSAISGLEFYPPSGGPYPAKFGGALFFADHARGCIWAMKPATPGGLPSPAHIEPFGEGAVRPVDLELGPGSELYYVDHGGTVRRIRYFAANQPPTAVINATPVEGKVPLTVNFSASQSSDPDLGDAGLLTYQWDFTNDGIVDATTVNATHTYLDTDSYTARLRVTDTLGAFDEQTVVISATGFAPSAFIDTPVAGANWAAGNVITYSGHGTDPETPANALTLSWQLNLMHCETPGNCHTHPMALGAGATGSFIAPDHEYPSHLELVLTVTDADGQTATLTRQLNPRTVTLNVDSVPSGISLTVGGKTATAPFSVEVIEGSTNTISAPASATVGGLQYAYHSWSDGGDRVHVIAPATSGTYTAAFTRVVGANPTAVIDTPSGGMKWKVGDVINFSGHASDPETPTANLSLNWQLRITHCEAQPPCHTHTTGLGTATSGSFQVPDHGINFYLELVFSVTDTDGQITTVTRRLDPRTVTLSFATKPTGLPLSVSSHHRDGPFTLEVVQGATVMLTAPESVVRNGRHYTFLSWSDRGPRVHLITASADASYQATYITCTGWIRFIRLRACSPIPRRTGGGSPGGVPRRTPY